MIHQNLTCRQMKSHSGHQYYRISHKNGESTQRGHLRRNKEIPTAKIEREINQAMKQIEQKGIIDRDTRLKLAPSHCQPPQIYGLPKIHLEDRPLIPIVASINSPTYNLAKELTKILSPLVVSLAIYSVSVLKPENVDQGCCMERDPSLFLEFFHQFVFPCRHTAPSLHLYLFLYYYPLTISLECAYVCC